jgi:hypothetical protein
MEIAGKARRIPAQGEDCGEFFWERRKTRKPQKFAGKILTWRCRTVKMARMRQ